MLVSAIVRTVSTCVRHPKATILASLVLAIASGYYAGTHFAINTDINKLISPSLDWRQREIAFEKLFPGHFDSTLVVVEAPTPELAARSTDVLASRLEENPALFHSVAQPGATPFFRHNALLFLPTADLDNTTKALGQAGPLIRNLAGDPTLRGLSNALGLALSGIRSKAVTLDQMARPMNMAADAVESTLAGKAAAFSWHELMNGRASEPGELRRLIDVRPVLDYSALEPGRAAADAIRKTAADLKLAEEYGARVRLTGPVAIADEEFATVRHGAVVNGIATVVVVLVILWLALRSGRIILAVFLNLTVGLAMTAALGLLMVGALNLISVAFAVLFVGLGVDFAIQFAVRYRAERHEVDDLKKALIGTAEKIGAPLTLAAAAVAAGFLSFTPTAYSGLSELGQIAGAGMLIAFATSITLLPALLTVLNPPGEPEEVGYRALAPVDRFLERHRIAVVGGTGLVAVLAAPLLFHLTFDFNPLNLRNKNVESVATFLDLRSDPNIGANAIDVVAPSLAEANATAERMKQIPVVARTMTVQSFVPDEQEQKLALIRDLEKRLGTALNPPGAPPPPSDANNVAALTRISGALTQAAGDQAGPGAVAAKRLSADLTKLAEAEPAMREKVQKVFVVPLHTVLDELRDYLKAAPVSVDNLPADLVSEWVSAAGRYRVQASPHGDPNDTDVLRSFANAVLAMFPDATGAPISIVKAGETIISAFFHAGAYALISISLLLLLVLKRFGDVLLTLVPLLLAGVLTLEICVLIGMPLNFANIIALPLLLGIGVAFKIYYIMAWRAGQSDLLQSYLTRAVFWSALTTATAFGSLWLSDHPGTSSMGKLLVLSLLTTMCAAVLFQPALMGKPREKKSA
jgi:hopanoid biosynthesis associated RND transporter like protein HpnN